MYAAISILMVIGFEGGKNSKFYSGSIAVLLNGSDDLDGHMLIPLSVPGLHNFAKSPLTKKFGYLVCTSISTFKNIVFTEHSHLSVRSLSGTTI